MLPTAVDRAVAIWCLLQVYGGDVMFAHNGQRQRRGKRRILKEAQQWAAGILPRRISKLTHQGATPDGGGV